MAGHNPAHIQQLVRSVPGYVDPTRIAQDCIECVSEQKSLVPKVETFVRNDGTESTLVCLHGTIPMVYGNKRYNCPVQLWLMHDYPSGPPTCYVKPTHDMAIKPRHVHVDSAGFIYHQYLTEWSPRSNLKVLCNTLSQVFGELPPVYARPSTGSASNAATSKPAARPVQPQPQPAARPQPAAAAAQPQPQQPPQPAQQPRAQAHAQQPPYMVPPQQKRPSHEDVAQQVNAAAAEPNTSPMNKRRSQEDIPRISEEERSRLELVALVSSKLQADYERYSRTSEEEFELYQAKQADLEDTRQCIDGAVTALQGEKDHLLAIMAQLDSTEQAVTAMLDARAKEPLPDVDTLVHASDPMARQLLGAVAHVKAIEDVLYHLDQALDGGSIDTEEYLRLTLRLSRQQFFEKELTNKILARRRQLGIL